MKKILIISTLLLLFAACNNYKTDDLYGSWTSEKVDLTFNKDKTMQCRLGPSEFSGRYRLFGNSVELINSDEKVIGSIAIKSLKNDSLVVDILQFSSNLYTLVRKTK